MAEFNQEAYGRALDKWADGGSTYISQDDFVRLYLEEVGKLESDDEFRERVATALYDAYTSDDRSFRIWRAVADRAIELVREHDKGKQ